MVVAGKIAVEEAKRLNSRNRENRQGCITTVYCEKCGAVHHDGICCCLSLMCGFKCLDCGEENVFLKFSGEVLDSLNEPIEVETNYLPLRVKMTEDSKLLFLSYMEEATKRRPFDYSQLYCSPEAFEDMKNWGKNPDGT